MEDLEGDDAAQFGVARAVDRPHPPAAKGVEDFKAPERPGTVV